jgi:aryl-alcohol dehydrogenase-like predicted oxidoreductase
VSTIDLPQITVPSIGFGTYGRPVWRDQAARDDVHRSVRESLDRLGIGHIDLLLLHWPADDLVPMEETLTALSDDDRARIDGLARGLRLIDPACAPSWDVDAPGL